MKKIVSLLVLLFSIVSEIEGSALRVVGGQHPSDDFGKFHASLQNLTGHHVCGGAIISEQHVLTAAHCVDGALAQHIRVVVGTTNLETGGLIYEVESIIINGRYNTSSRANDIAMLKIKELFDPKSVEILNLNKNELSEGDNVILTGFGAVDNTNTFSSSKMQALELPVFNQETCRYAMRYATRKVTDGNFCTFSNIGEGTCYGDSGGPLLKNGKLVGLVSWGIPCAVGFPDVHTRITPYISWVEELTKF